VQWFGEQFDVSSNGELCFRGGGMEIDNLVVGLRGRHQRENAAVALAAAVTVGSSYSLSPQAMRAGLAQVRWPGRLEVFGQQPLVLLDGAHNEDGIAALCRELPDVVRERPLHLVFSVMRDKAWRPMVDRLAPLVASVVLTTASPRRAAPPEELADVFAKCCPVEIVHEPAAAYARAVQRAGSDGAVLVTGSLFLIGDIYSSVLRRSEEERLFDTAYPALHP
jgi:dihydrofolate synthase/folylpolyglutamate synthase